MLPALLVFVLLCIVIFCIYFLSNKPDPFLETLELSSTIKDFDPLSPLTPEGVTSLLPDGFTLDINEKSVDVLFRGRFCISFSKEDDLSNNLRDALLWTHTNENILFKYRST